MKKAGEKLLAALSDARAAGVFILVGLSARAMLYLHNRSLWLDEAYLSKSIVHRSYADLMKPLDYLQCSPIGFLWIERLFGSMFGFREYGLRLFPLLCGAASLFLFHRLARRLLSVAGTNIAVILFACTPSLIYYSAEIKQYSTEVMVGLGLISLALRVLSPSSGLGVRLALVAAGIAAIGLSFSSVFLLAGIGAVWLVEELRAHRPKWAAICCGAGLVWSAAFLAYQYFILRHYDLTGQINAFGSDAVFWHMPPKVPSDLIWPAAAAINLIAYPLLVKSVAAALLLIALGIAELRSTNLPYCLMIGLAFAAALLAAALRRYPFGGRMSLYLVPFLLVWLSAGLDSLRLRLGRDHAAVFLAILGLVLYTPVLTAMELAVTPSIREEIKPALDAVNRGARPGDVLYVYSQTRPAFEYYRADFPNVVRMDTVVASEENYTHETVSAAVAGLQTHPRAWLLFTHCAEEERCLRLFTEYAMERRSRLMSVTKTKDAWLYLYANGN